MGMQGKVGIENTEGAGVLSQQQLPGVSPSEEEGVIAVGWAELGDERSSELSQTAGRRGEQQLGRICHIPQKRFGRETW